MNYILLFLTFLKIGAFTFGGGHAMIPLIQEEVLRYNWMTIEELINFIAISEGTPGPFAINIATFVGYKFGGVVGAILATIGVIITSFIIILIITKYLEKYKDNKCVKYCIEGIKPVTVGLIGSAIISMIIKIFFPNGEIIYLLTTTKFWLGVFICIISLAFSIKKVHPIKIILISAILGIILMPI